MSLALLLTHTAQAVAAVRAGRSLTEALAAVPGAARGGVQALSFTVLRHAGAAQHLREALVKKPPPAAQDALLLTALALLWPQGDEAPYEAHTLVNQAVQAARSQSKSGAPFPAFMNAVLRRFLREQARLREAVAALPTDHPARTQHPLWWAQRLRQDWPAKWLAMMVAANQPAPMTLRVNTRRGAAEPAVQAYLERLAAAGLPARRVGEQAVMLESPCPVNRLPGFDAGDVSVQDAAAQRAAPLLLGGWAGPSVAGRAPAGGAPDALALKAQPRVLDACAAPGGKTVHLLELAELQVWAIDRDAQRMDRVRENLTRLGEWGQSVVLKAADAAEPQTWWDGEPFDAILLDAPCSASGIVRRHPDVRWLRRESDIAGLAQTQSALLDALWPLLAPGGRLLYCTCSVFRAEGETQIEAFLQRIDARGGAIRLPAPGHLPGLPDNADSPPQSGPLAPAAPQAAWPAEDGFFYALLQKPVPS
jgi:16S rRNA (cytosine967-C5)-methyltransferase